MTYKVRIEETLVREVEVEANSRNEAYDIVLDRYGRQDIVLGADDYCDTDISVAED